MTQTWRLDGQHQSLVLAAHTDELAQIIYWGARLPQGEDLQALYDASVPDITGGMLDENPALSICPLAQDTFPGQPGLIAFDSNGAPVNPHFHLRDVHLTTEQLMLEYGDREQGLSYRAKFIIDPVTDIITATASLKSEQPVQLYWMSAPVFPAAQHSTGCIDFFGRWCGEFQLNRTSWNAGIRQRENRTGRTGHEHFPGLIIETASTTNISGEAWGCHFGWSGGHRMLAEELADGRRQIQFGIASGILTEPVTYYETPAMYLSYSQTGLNGCAVAFQRHLRDRLVVWPEPDRPRPVHYNCWEAVYFDHKPEELKEIASLAAELGAERFVLDDGWFGRRDDDTSSLGDWLVDTRKYPQGLTPLIEHIHSLGMTFGIWFEPEMVNPNSALFAAHPDWVSGSSDQILGRQQMVLNMARREVQDYLFDSLSAILTSYDIDYIKWDHNRVLPYGDAAQTYGTYALLDRLRTVFPQTEIESCASGGGRIDFGILSRTQRVWLSDSNDATERLKIQHNAALFLPMAVTGSHVGPRHCHTSGRQLSMSFRAWVAAQRHMGFEMDPRELTDEEAGILKQVTGWWRRNRDWMMGADILRLDSSDPAVIAEMQLAEDKSQFVVFAGKAETSTQIAPRPLRLTGLDAHAFYHIELVNRNEAHHLSRGSQKLKSENLRLSGRYLMQAGLTLPWSFPETMWVVKGERI